MNIQLSNAEEFIDDKLTGALGQVLIRWVPHILLFHGGARGSVEDRKQSSQC